MTNIWPKPDWMPSESSFSYEIVWLLEQRNVGGFSENLFLGSKASIPPGNGPFITLIDTGGTGPVRTHGGANIERPSGLISVRCITYGGALDKLQSVYEALGGSDGLRNVLLYRQRYLSIKARNGFADAGVDGSGRIMLSFNIDAERLVTKTVLEPLVPPPPPQPL